MRPARVCTGVPVLLGVSALALAAAGCSAKAPEAGPSVPAYTPEASATADVSASGSAGGATASVSPTLVALEPAALSDPEDGYEVKELPQGLDEKSQAILRGFLA
ncbi:hypothetical protein [Actinomyces trachealis]|uniref:hypothetical protein n=1 Tax=Actinomyces trachealis TaxID=2763540 RepID=UPI001892B214|nr:hypothetical protein [Actinomyces trachealis]